MNMAVHADEDDDDRIGQLEHKLAEADHADHDMDERPQTAASDGTYGTVQKYTCPKCGRLNGDNLHLIVPDKPELGGEFCGECFAKWVAANVPRIAPVEKAPEPTRADVPQTESEKGTLRWDEAKGEFVDATTCEG